MPRRTIPLLPPPIDGVRRRMVTARDVSFHVTEAGDPDGLPVLALHGWPQHHYAWRNLLAEPPAGLRIIAPDLPGYGWSGPAPHRWGKEDVAQDLLALMDALELEQVVLLGHDWGGYVSYLMLLAAPQRFHAYVAVNIAHPWPSKLSGAKHFWRFLQYQPLMAIFGQPIMRYTPAIERLVLTKALTDPRAMSTSDRRCFADRFRDPVNARTGRDTYRTFFFGELPRLAVRPETRRATVPIRAIFGTGDVAIHPDLAAAKDAKADDYTIELVEGVGHFLPDERPDLLRAHLLETIAELVPAAVSR